MKATAIFITGWGILLLPGLVRAGSPSQAVPVGSAAVIDVASTMGDAKLPAPELTKMTIEQLNELGRAVDRITSSVVALSCNPLALCSDPGCEPWCNPVCSAFDPCRCGGCVTCPCMSSCNPQCNPACSQFNLCTCNGRCSPLCPTAACDSACVNPACVPVCPQFNPCVCRGPCDPTCPTALCNAQCGTHPECNPVCGGNGCNAGCPTFCTCPQNLCNPACGDPDCNPLCGGAPCSLSCEANRCTALCVENLACQQTCGGDPCSDACAATISGLSKFCDANRCPVNHTCNLACGGDKCASGCPDECTPVLCTQNALCERSCGGDPCGAACVAYDQSNFGLFCDPNQCPSNHKCNLLCGGDPCASGCSDECDPIICSANEACLVHCGGDPCSEGCLAATFDAGRFCDQTRCPQNRCNDVCSDSACNTDLCPAAVCDPLCPLAFDPAKCDCRNGPCSWACTTACDPDLCPDAYCNPGCSGVFDPFRCACRDNPCAFGCFTTQCDPDLCPQNVRCDPFCGGTPCSYRDCGGYCDSTCPTNLYCDAQCGGNPCVAGSFLCPGFCAPGVCPENARCNLFCGGDPTNAQCSATCGGNSCNCDRCGANCSPECTSGCPQYDPCLCGNLDPCLCHPCGEGCDPCGCHDPNLPDCNQNGVNDLCDVSRFDQWASEVIGFSSQYSDPAWAASQALGPPDTSDYCDCPTSWAPGPINGTHEFLLVGFAQPVHASGVTIHETTGHGFVYKIDLLDTIGALHTVFSGVDPSTPLSANLVVTFAPTPYLARGVKIYVDTDHNLNEWEEVDAVRLHSQRPSARSLDTNLDDIPDECQMYDCNGDGVIDRSDWECMVRCLHGPNAESPYDCNRSDANHDHNVDLSDVQQFLNRLPTH